MAKHQSQRTRLGTVLRGMKEVIKITLNKNADLKTDFVAQKPEDTKTPDNTPTDDKVPLRKISGNNELIIAPEYMPEMISFFHQHALLDIYSAPCFFNNDACDITLCAFPRIIRSHQGATMVKDVISVTIQSNNAIVAMAEYNTADNLAVQQFERDMETLTPMYYRNHNSKDSLQNALAQRFPGIILNEEPVFLSEDASRKELPHAL